MPDNLWPLVTHNLDWHSLLHQGPHRLLARPGSYQRSHQGRVIVYACVWVGGEEHPKLRKFLNCTRIWIPGLNIVPIWIGQSDFFLPALFSLKMNPLILRLLNSNADLYILLAIFVHPSSALLQLHSALSLGLTNLCLCKCRAWRWRLFFKTIKGRADAIDL